MAAKLAIFTVALSLGTSAQILPKFMGREVTIIEAERDENGFHKGPASVCVEGPSQRQCYTAPEEYGNNPTVALVQLNKDTPALFYSAESAGVSGWRVHFALLRPGAGKDLEDLLWSDASVSNQNQHAFWNDAAISASPIFLTADFVWGPDEGHYLEHRYVISAYVRRSSYMVDDLLYYLEDRYMTIRKYDLDAKADILASEKPEILARLERIKAAAQSRH